MKLKVKNKTSKKFKKGINVQLCSNLKVCVHIQWPNTVPGS